MSYSAACITIRKGARKTIARQSRPVREQTISEIDRLEADPDDPMLEVERLVGGPEWRLRFKGPAHRFRAIFVRDDPERTLDVRVIAPRGEVYRPRRRGR
jgi:mRNA-degrading endonuclease RelE of RelBE toxin-antitoxin system